jgi:hypothetical protein
MFNPGDVISYIDMCRESGVSFQRGMYFHLKSDISVLLMSRRRDAPYEDQVEEDGRVLIYEGHDVPRIRGGPEPKNIDQPDSTPGGTTTQNGLFYEAAQLFKETKKTPELVKVYEKVHRGIWVYNGMFRLVDAWKQRSGSRRVFKFKLELTEAEPSSLGSDAVEQEHPRLIPTSVKLEVWKRDKGGCAVCGAKQNLHFDHILPYSKGGSSCDAKNVQLLCARHNLEKHDNIQ